MSAPCTAFSASRSRHRSPVTEDEKDEPTPLRIACPVSWTRDNFCVSERQNAARFILAGQSNMQGQAPVRRPQRNGGRGSLEYLAKNEPTASHFKQLLDAKGDWAVREDVWITYLDRKGPLTVGFVRQ